MARRGTTRRTVETIGTLIDAGRGINVIELAEELIAAFGGARAFAATYHTEFATGTKPGSISRSKMLDGVLRIISSATQANKGKEKDITGLSDEELADEMLRLLQ